MRKMRFEFGVVTPLFLGGAVPSAEAELRLPSIKGMLRWWFRVLGGDRCMEEKVFGSTNYKSSVRMSLNSADVKIAPHWAKTFSPELAYLGYGPISWAKATRDMRNARPYIEPGSKFQMIAESSGEYDSLLPFVLSVWTLGFLGGLGSRNRRGWGSVKVKPQSPFNLLRFDFDDPPDFVRFIESDFIPKVIDVFGEFPDTSPKYPRLFRGTKIIVGNPEKKWQLALKRVGKVLINFRKKRFYSDVKNLMKEAEEKGCNVSRILNPSRYHQRYNSPVPKSIFGLPNNYMSKSRRSRKNFPWQVSVEGKLEGKELPRRASPFIISVSKWKDGTYSWILTYIPSQFLPNKASLKLGFPSRGLKSDRDPLKKVEVLAPAPNYLLAEEFLEKLKQELNPLEVSL